ncbi:hypothetical protein K9L27_03165 [Candidatus Gracilibacteria bacterium]|nr:hypothetical protein [Candidatus Gracilibacteria bacterium]
MDKIKIKNKTIQELLEDYENSEGLCWYDFFICIDYSFYSFRENFKELMKHIEKYEKEIFSTQKNTEFKDVHLSLTKTRNYRKKFFRLFYNYVATTYSLEENYINFLVDKKEDPIIGKNFETINKVPERLFVFALRNFTTHHKTFNFSNSIEHIKTPDFQGGNFIITTKGQFVIKKADILSDFDKVLCDKSVPQKNKNSEYLYNKKSLSTLHSYIHQNFKNLNINLKDVVQTHFDLFNKHLNTINDEIKTKNKKAISEARALNKEIVKKQNSIVKQKIAEKVKR